MKGIHVRKEFKTERSSKEFISNGIGAQKVRKSEIDLSQVRAFFVFFESYGVNHWFIEAFPRKLDGKRGAPILSRFENLKFDKPIGGAHKITNSIRRAHRFMLNIEKKADIHIKESPEVDTFHRTILIDDLELYFLEQLSEDYPGPLVAIETSTYNYQAILIAPRFPKDQARTKFRGLLKSEVLEIQRGLAQKYQGDTGAVAAGQFHRFAGSPNYKNNQLNDGKPFYSKIAIMRGETGTPEDAEAFLKSAIDSESSKTAVNADLPNKAEQILPAPSVAPKTFSGHDQTESGEAFRFALKSLRKLVPPTKVIAEVQSRWGTGRSENWSERTVHNALYTIGIKPTRYSRRAPMNNDSS